MARRTAQDAFFTASLLCGLAIICTVYMADPKAAPAPLVSVDAGRKLLQVPTTPSAPVTPAPPAPSAAPVTPAPPAPSSSPAAPLRPPTASPSALSPPPAAAPTPAASPAATGTPATAPAEPPTVAAGTTSGPDSIVDQAAGGMAPTDPAGSAPDAADPPATAATPDGTDSSPTAEGPSATDPSAAAVAPNGTDPSIVDDTLDPVDPAPGHWQFPWRKFWLWTGFVCAGAGACGLVAGLVLGTLQGFGVCQNCSCDPESGPKGTTTGHAGSHYSGASSYSSGSSSDCCHGPGAGEAMCCLFIVGVAFLAIAVYLLMPLGAASLGYGSGYVVGAALATAIVLTCPCTDACRARRREWKDAWAERAAAARARAGLPPAAAAPVVALPSAKVTSDACDAGCKAGGHDMHSVDLEAVVVPPRQAAAFELC